MSRWCEKALWCVLILSGEQCVSRVARADSTNSAAAQALYDQAKELFANGHAAEACPKFEESQRLDPGSGTLMNLARCYDETGRVASAWSTYLEAAASAKTTGNTAREAVARKRVAELAPHVPKLVITVDPETKLIPQLQISQDGVLIGAPEWGVPLPADPGEHQLSAQAPGYTAWHGKVTVVAESATNSVTVPKLEVQPTSTSGSKPPPPLAPESTPMHETHGGLGTARIAALVAGGVGVVGVGLGTFFGLESKSKHDQAAQACPSTMCRDAGGVAASKDAVSAGNLSTAMMIVGGVGLAAGVTLWLTAPKPEHSPTAQLNIGPGSLQVKAIW